MLQNCFAYVETFRAPSPPGEFFQPLFNRLGKPDGKHKATSQYKYSTMLLRRAKNPQLHVAITFTGYASASRTTRGWYVRGTTASAMAISRSCWLKTRRRAGFHSPELSSVVAPCAAR